MMLDERNYRGTAGELRPKIVVLRKSVFDRYVISNTHVDITSAF